MPHLATRNTACASASMTLGSMTSTVLATSQSCAWIHRAAKRAANPAVMASRLGSRGTTATASAAAA